MLAERALDFELDPLAGERLAVEREDSVRPLGALQQLEADGHARLDRAAGAADAGELVLGLHASAFVEEALIGRELDPLRAQVVGLTEREGIRSHRGLETELPHGVQVQLALDLVRVEPALQQLVDADVLVREHVEPRAELRDAARLERADDDGTLAAGLRVEERIGHGERHLVAQLGRADGVGDDQHIGHRADPNGR